MVARRLSMIAVFVACFSVGLAARAAEPADSAVGQKLDEFSMADIYGKKHQLADYANQKLVVLAFLGAECPRARLYAPRLSELAKKYEASGVAVLGVSSNAQDNITELKNFARLHGVTFPVLKDSGNVLADRLHAARVPEVFVLDADRVVRYHGRIDDQYGLQASDSGKAVAYQLAAPRRQDLALALDELLAGKAVSVAETEASGCLIGRQRKPRPDSDITYSNQIARVLTKNCVFCHREGQIGPFALTNYEDAAGWAEMINEVVQEQRMPPWHADPRYGQFANDCRLTDEDKQLIARWVAAGAPQGDPGDLPEPPKFAAGWMIPEPDQVIYMGEPFSVPAEGTVPYQSFVVDPGWTENKWVTAMEPKPGNPAVVHHIVMYVVPPRGASKYYTRRLAQDGS